jgi:hypothetical protein
VSLCQRVKAEYGWWGLWFSILATEIKKSQGWLAELLHGVGDVRSVQDVVVSIEVENCNCVRAGR